MATGQGQIDNLTGVRAFAAIWVVPFHLQLSPIIGSQIDFGNICAVGYWGVDVFFVLSGLVLAYVYESKFRDTFVPWTFAKYLALRLGRMYPLHIAMMLAFLVFYLLQSNFGNHPPQKEHFGWYNALMNILLVHAWGTTDTLSWNSVSWSISAEWFAYLFLLVPIVRICKHWPMPARFTAATAGWLLFMYYVAHTEAKTLDVTYNFGIARVAAEFFAGYVLYRYSRIITLTPIWSDVLTFSGIAAILVLAHFMLPPVLLLPCIGVALLGLMGPGKAAARVFGNKASVFLGEISYAIYMIHAFVFICTDTLISRLGVQNSVSLAVGLIVLNCVLVLLMATVSYYALEHPCREWVRKRVQGW